MRGSHPMRIVNCARCGAVESRSRHGRQPPFCFKCSHERMLESQQAHSKVARAIHRGDLPPPTELLCSDCAKPASEYDHRDYTAPLAVEAVCRSCNCKRGPALDKQCRELPKKAA